MRVVPFIFIRFVELFIIWARDHRDAFPSDERGKLRRVVKIYNALEEEIDSMKEIAVELQ